MGSITDATGEKPTSTGNGIAEYKVADGQVTPERFIKIPPQPVADGKVVAYEAQDACRNRAAVSGGICGVAGRKR